MKSGSADQAPKGLRLKRQIGKKTDDSIGRPVYDENAFGNGFCLFDVAAADEEPVHVIADAFRS